MKPNMIMNDDPVNTHRPNILTPETIVKAVFECEYYLFTSESANKLKAHELSHNSISSVINVNLHQTQSLLSN